MKIVIVDPGQPALLSAIQEAVKGVEGEFIFETFAPETVTDGQTGVLFFVGSETEPLPVQRARLDNHVFGTAAMVSAHIFLSGVLHAAEVIQLEAEKMALRVGGATPASA